MSETSKAAFIRDGPLSFYRGRGGGGVPLLGLADNFFLKNNAFQTIFDDHFLKHHRLSYRSYLK